MIRPLAAVVLALLVFPVAAQPVHDIDKVLQTLGLEQLLILTGQRVNAQQPSGHSVDGEALQQQFSAQLAKAFRPAFVEASWALTADNVASLQRQCHQQTNTDLAAALQAYQQQLESRSPLPQRKALAEELAALSRSAKLAAIAHTGLEQLAYQDNREIDWQVLQSLRQAEYQQRLLAWYLYCGRGETGASWEGLLKAWGGEPVQQLLDQVELALVATLANAATQTGGKNDD